MKVDCTHKLDKSWLYSVSIDKNYNVKKWFFRDLIFKTRKSEKGKLRFIDVSCLSDVTIKKWNLLYKTKNLEGFGYLKIEKCDWTILDKLISSWKIIIYFAFQRSYKRIEKYLK